MPERSWVQSLLPSTEVEPVFSTFGGMLVPVLQLISPVCKTGTSLKSEVPRKPFSETPILTPYDGFDRVRVRYVGPRTV
jgi:hypothetical protein